MEKAQIAWEPCEGLGLGFDEGEWGKEEITTTEEIDERRMIRGMEGPKKKAVYTFA